ncbi:hypothetical protein ACYX34_15205 [Nitrospira sp. CMX1]
MSHQLPSFPEFDAFQPKHTGEAKAYRMIIEAICKHLSAEPAVHKLLAHWDKKIGLSALAKKTGGDASTKQRELAQTRFKKAVWGIPTMINAEALEAAMKWELPYPWLVSWLIQSFILKHGAEPAGLAFSRSFEVPPLRYWLEVTLDYGDAKSLKQHLARLKREGLALLKDPKSRSPKQDGHLSRYAFWLVRHHVGGLSISALATEWHNSEHITGRGPLDCQNDQRTVRIGIDRAKALLDLTAYRIQDSPERN